MMMLVAIRMSYRKSEWRVKGLGDVHCSARCVKEHTVVSHIHSVVQTF